MELKESIERRRSIRKFKKEEVDRKIIEEAIKYGVMAPSAHNRQPWKFKILTTKEKDAIADMLYEKTKDIEGHTGPHTAGVIKEAPNMVIVFLDSVKDRDMDVISVGACIENMILYLTAKDIGTLWIGNTNFISEEIKEYFKTDLETISCLAIGYKDQEPHQRPRKPIEEVYL